jgi:hypothetical protein
MTKPKISTKKYEASLVAARKKGGNENQAHWQARLKVVMKRRAKSAKKASKR